MSRRITNQRATHTVDGGTDMVTAVTQKALAGWSHVGPLLKRLVDLLAEFRAGWYPALMMMNFSEGNSLQTIGMLSSFTSLS